MFLTVNMFAPLYRVFSLHLNAIETCIYFENIIAKNINFEDRDFAKEILMGNLVIDFRDRF